MTTISLYNLTRGLSSLYILKNFWIAIQEYLIVVHIFRLPFKFICVLLKTIRLLRAYEKRTRILPLPEVGQSNQATGFGASRLDRRRRHHQTPLAEDETKPYPGLLRAQHPQIIKDPERNSGAPGCNIDFKTIATALKGLTLTTPTKQWYRHTDGSILSRCKALSRSRSRTLL